MHARKGIAALERLSQGEAREQLELRLLILLGTAQFSVYGFAAAEVGHTFARAKALSDRAGAAPEQLQVLLGLWLFYFVRADYQISSELLRKVTQIALDVDDARFTLLSHVLTTCNATATGDFREAQLHGQAAWTAYDPNDSAKLRATFGMDIGTSNGDWTSWSLWALGYPDATLKLQRQVLSLAQTQGEPYMLAQVLAHTAIIDHFRKDAPAVLEHAQAAIEVSQAHGIPLRLAEGQILLGWARAELGAGEANLAHIEAAVEAWNRIGARIANPIWFSLIALAYWRNDRLIDARRWLSRAIAELEETGEGLWQSELYRLDGELLLIERPLNVDQVESRFKLAIEVARAQRAKMIELRSVASLARLWHKQGRSADAYAALTRVYSCFTEGFDTKDLQETKALLAELRG